MLTRGATGGFLPVIADKAPRVRRPAWRPLGSRGEQSERHRILAGHLRE
jgi:hypothetical protein